MTDTLSLDYPEAWTDLLVTLAACLRDPDADLVDAVETGELEAELTRLAATLDLQPAVALQPPGDDALGDLTQDALALFQALETPYAPNAESPYKPWYGDRAGLMAGPPAQEMTARYQAIAGEHPAGYPTDHVALLLEYGAVLLETGDLAAFDAFQATHYDWFPAFRLATEGAAAPAPFHRWAVRLLDDVTATLRARLGDEPVDAVTVRAMVDRIGHANPGDADPVDASPADSPVRPDRGVSR